MKEFILIASLFVATTAMAIPNPAAVYCKNQGGKSLKILSKEGEYALCTFGKGRIEQWTLLRAANGSTQEAVIKFLNAKVMARSPEQKCILLNGAIIVDKLANGADISLCEFKDGSKIEAETLFSGAGNSVNAKLVKVLRRP